jgi:hypothetical protein
MPVQGEPSPISSGSQNGTTTLARAVLLRMGTISCTKASPEAWSEEFIKWNWATMSSVLDKGALPSSLLSTYTRARSTTGHPESVPFFRFCSTRSFHTATVSGTSQGDRPQGGAVGRFFGKNVPREEVAASALRRPEARSIARNECR